MREIILKITNFREKIIEYLRKQNKIYIKLNKISFNFKDSTTYFSLFQSVYFLLFVNAIAKKNK